MEIVSVREDRKFTKKAIEYFQKYWASDDSMMVYEDCIENTEGDKASLPQWYLLLDGEKIVGSAGLITNDFISRMDLYPWLCALYIEEEYRGKHLGNLLMKKAMEDSKSAGFENMYLCTDHVGYYEKYGFDYIGDGYHPWGEKSRIYRTKL